MVNGLAVQTKEVSFLEDTLLAAEINGEVFVAVKNITDALGFTKGQYDRQVKNIKADLVLAGGASNLALPTAGGLMDVTVMNITYLPLWLAKISLTPKMLRDTPRIAEKLVGYQLKAKDVLYDAFFGKQIIGFEDMMIAQLQEQKKIKAQIAAQEVRLNEQQVLIEENTKRVEGLVEHLSQSPDRAVIRRYINEYTRRHNVSQDHAWAELTGKILDIYGLDVVRRVANKRKSIQLDRLNLGKKPYAESTLKSKYTAVDVILEENLGKEAIGILAGLIG